MKEKHKFRKMSLKIATLQLSTQLATFNGNGEIAIKILYRYIYIYFTLWNFYENSQEYTTDQ